MEWAFQRLNDGNYVLKLRCVLLNISMALSLCTRTDEWKLDLGSVSYLSKLIIDIVKAKEPLYPEEIEELVDFKQSV